MSPEQTTVLPRPITPQILVEFMEWTREAPMFLTSPEGRAFAQELRVVLELAKVGNEFLERCADAK
jgi:hypothetical protein